MKLLKMKNLLEDDETITSRTSINELFTFKDRENSSLKKYSYWWIEFRNHCWLLCKERLWESSTTHLKNQPWNSFIRRC